MNNNRPFRRSITIHGKYHDRGKRFHAKTAVYTLLQHGRPLARQPAPLDMPTTHPSPPALHQRPRHAPCPYQRRNRLLCLQGTVWSWTSATADVHIVSLVQCWRQAAPPARKQPCKSRHFMREEKKKLCACYAPAHHRVFKPARGEFKQAATAFPRLISPPFPPSSTLNGGIWILHPPRSFIHHLFIKINK